MSTEEMETMGRRNLTSLEFVEAKRKSLPAISGSRQRRDICGKVEKEIVRVKVPERVITRASYFCG